MISIQINNLGKKFNKEWIFRNLSLNILANQKLVILGGNGSGKSTLLQLISGFSTPNEGSLNYYSKGKKIEQDKIKKNVSFASPYIQLIEDFTLEELINHLLIYKPFINDLKTEQIIELIDLKKEKNKFINQFSSGMKQRLKVGLAVLSATELLLLDEPLSNLDKNACDWYKQIISCYSFNKTVIVCSNATHEEYFFCDAQINVAEFKN